ncbi:MAG: hypothetical protein GQ564_05965 [Bacteroidales bacterium]|nr:hypothetical protein [Bacteroidales bacterium]
MKNVKKSKVRNEKKVIEILKLNELLKIRGGETPDTGAPTQRDNEIN